MVIYRPVLENLMFHNSNVIYFFVLTILSKFIEVFYLILNPLLFFVSNKKKKTQFYTSY